MQPFSFPLLCTLLFPMFNGFGIVPQINSQTVRRKVYLYEGTIRGKSRCTCGIFVPHQGPGRRSPGSFGGSSGIISPKQIPFVTEWGSPWDEASKVGGLSTSDQPILALALPVYGEYTYYPCCSYRFD